VRGEAYRLTLYTNRYTIIPTGGHHVRSMHPAPQRNNASEKVCALGPVCYRATTDTKGILITVHLYAFGTAPDALTALGVGVVRGDGAA
jgi:hypothetical protein